jgi:hypothetical protein
MMTVMMMMVVISMTIIMAMFKSPHVGTMTLITTRCTSRTVIKHRDY